MALATPEDVVGRLEEEPTEGMLRMIGMYLEDASDEARYHGREWEDGLAPSSVQRLVASAVARFMRNPDRFSQTRSSDETLAFQPGEIDWFTDLERERLGRIARGAKLPGFGTIQMAAYSKAPIRRHCPNSNAVYVPVLSGSDFPFLTTEG